MATITPVQRSFISEGLEIPAVRDRLQRGVKLHDLAALQKFLEENREQAFLKKEYGYLVQDLEFLQAVGALEMPDVEHSKFITLKPHWVAINGYFNVNPFTLSREGVESRFVINTPSVRTPILILDNQAWRIYRLALRFGRLTRYQALAYLVYLLEVSHLTDEHAVSDAYIKHVVSQYDTDSMREEAMASYTRLVEAAKIEDPCGALSRILDEVFCLPTNSWIFSDGWYHLITMPSTLFADDGREDYTGNYVQSWDFFVTES